METYQQEFCQNYLNLVTRDFASLNLTRILDRHEFYEKQFYDSIAPFQCVDELKSQLHLYELIVDLGFGGGFPILPLAVEFPEKYFVGLDGKKKKVEAVTKISHDLNIENVKVIHGRIGEIFYDEAICFVTKAVGKITSILNQLKSSEESIILFYKGPNVKELEKVPSKVNNWNHIGEWQLELFGKYKRSYFLYKNVPHGTRNAKKLLVNLTELL